MKESIDQAVKEYKKNHENSVLAGEMRRARSQPAAAQTSIHHEEELNDQTTIFKIDDDQSPWLRQASATPLVENQTKSAALKDDLGSPSLYKKGDKKLFKDYKSEHKQKYFKN